MGRRFARWAFLPLVAVIGGGGLPCHWASAPDAAPTGVAWAMPVSQGMPQEVRVDLTEWGLTPPQVTVAAGRPVRFVVTNHGALPHALAVEGDALYAETAGIGSSRSTPLIMTFSNPGVYDVFCPIGTGQHRLLGQEGTLTVVNAAPGMKFPLIGQPAELSPTAEVVPAMEPDVADVPDVGPDVGIEVPAEPTAEAESDILDG